MVLCQLTECKSDRKKENVVIMQPLGIDKRRSETRQEKILTNT